MKRKQMSSKQDPFAHKQTPLMWSGLQFRMTLSYALTTFIAVLIIEIVLGMTVWALLTYGPWIDNGFMVNMRAEAKLYAVAASAQAEGGTLSPTATFEPGHPSSIPFGKTYAPDATTIQYISTRIPDQEDPAFVLLIASDGHVLASSYPARYPRGESIAHLFPSTSPLVAQALQGIPGSSTDQTKQGRVVQLVEPVWSRKNTVIGAIYLQAPIISGGTLLQRFTLFWFVSGVFWLVVMMLVGGIFGLMTTRGLVRRLRHLVTATTRFARGDYLQRVRVSRWDEVGQLEQHFNEMAEQLIESTARQQKLAEQGARLEERARIARDLHDSVKQQVFATAMQVCAAIELLDVPDAPALKHLFEAEALTHQIQQELTTLIQQLRPLALQDNKGLALALYDYVKTWSRQQGIPADVAVSETCDLPLPVEEALLRIVQEALSNVARHSQASHVQITLDDRQDQMTLAIVDNGRGFDVTHVKGAGVGLHSMRERVEALGGTITIESEPGQGTRLVVQYACPLASYQ